MNLQIPSNTVILKIDTSPNGFDDMVTIETTNGLLRFSHYQSCCESVWLEDQEGDLEALIGSTILEVVESTNVGEMPLEDQENRYDDCNDYYFYTVKCTNGEDLWLRFHGTSNGYYSTQVDVEFNNASRL